jgi:acyl-coenzyme A synthetase/AMP-(fatty) acid ligase
MKAHLMNNIVSLSKIFDGPLNRSSACFIREKETVDWYGFEQDVAFTAAKLMQHTQKEWLLFCDDVYWFTVGIAALSYAAKDIILPPNMQQGSLKDMEGKVDACLTDRISSDLNIPLVLLERSSVEKVELDNENYFDVSVTLKTSGTTGAPTHIKKRISHLEAEVFKLDDKWRLTGQNIIMTSTVSHFHIYGLLYQVIWPLMSGLSVYCNRIDYPEQLSELSGGKNFNLISSPAFLKRWQKELSHYKAPKELKLIFSSGGKLPEDVGAKLSKNLSVPIFEIYGSTETGGIATRQCAVDNYWMGIKGVSLTSNENELLEVLSDHTGEADWITMGDKVLFHNADQFSIIGRADRIEKVEEKRLSLAQIEQHLISAEEINEVRVEILRQQNRDTVGVVAVLSNQGNDLLNSIGKKQLTRDLNHKLKNYYEAVLLPRKWRFIESMPYNSQGKIEQKSILKLFKNSIFPDVKNINYQGDKLILDIHIEAHLDCFEGHFEGLPILPGVIQLDWASYYAGKYFNLIAGFAGAEAIKFIKIISPDEHLTLILEQKNNKVYFSYEKEHEIYSSGKLLLGKINE